MKKLELTSLQEVADQLNDDFKSIKDYKAYVDLNKLRGGFYWIKCYNIDNQPYKYALHETFGRLKDEKSYNELYSYLHDRVIEQLEWQKETDEEFAKEDGIDVKYKFDYSLLSR